MVRAHLRVRGRGHGRGLVGREEPRPLRPVPERGEGQLAVAVGPGAAPAAPALPTVRMRGTLDSLTGDTLAMTTRAGEKVTVQLQPNWSVRATFAVKM